MPQGLSAVVFIGDCHALYAIPEASFSYFKIDGTTSRGIGH
ncbi:Hypothetical protein EAG7_01787 [Klebsiella aerogenes]|nr:Hypothetical protein EAG7_01787 [Klebsiella aerogenes]